MATKIGGKLENSMPPSHFKLNVSMSKGRNFASIWRRYSKL